MSQKRKPKGAPRDRIRLTIPGASEVIEIPRQLPLLPLRDVVVFPQVTLPLFVGRSRSVAAIEDAICRQKILFATAQCRPEVAQPSEQDLYPVGTIVRILQLFRLPDGTLRILAEGIERARSETMLEKADNLNAIIALEPDETSPEDLCRQLMVSVKRDFSRCVELDRRLVPEVGVAVRGVADPTALSW
ncbi:MAG: LON peptidase substrate-binding domain-containing protein, partial [Candidatus Eisenbacteria sp.]|nr:LON peptidase substrate-binding domain-containing protein [Candidatus Eisenbacteria bacterium]